MITIAIVEDDKNASKRFARAIDFYLVQDFSSAVSDLTQTILLDGDFFPAYFMRALIRWECWVSLVLLLLSATFAGLI